MNSIAAGVGMIAGGVVLSTAGGALLRNVEPGEGPADGPGVPGALAWFGGGTLAVAGASFLSAAVKSPSALAFAGVMAGGLAAGAGAMVLGWKLSDAIA